MERRDAQHGGRVPQRDGTVCEQPWYDLRVGGLHVLEEGMWTDAELDARERYWIAGLQPRYNDKDNPRPDRIRKFEARAHRDARDVARGLVPRQWAPVRVDPVVPAGRVWPVAKRVLRSRWTWWLAAWFVAMVALAVVDVPGQDLTLRQAAYISAVACVGSWLWWRFVGRVKLRRWMRRR